MRRDEDRRDRLVGGGQLLLKLEAVHAAEVDVQHAAGGRPRGSRGQELLGGGERGDPESRAGHEAAESAAERGVVFHHPDHQRVGQGPESHDSHSLHRPAGNRYRTFVLVEDPRDPACRPCGSARRQTAPPSSASHCRGGSSPSARHAELTRDLLVEQPGDHESQHVPLARGQVAKRRSTTARSARSARLCRLRARPRCTQAIRSGPRKGFSRKSTAPPSWAHARGHVTVAGHEIRISPAPPGGPPEVHPARPRHPDVEAEDDGRSTAGLSRNSRAEARASTSRPAVRSRRATALRKEASSSIT